MVHFILEVWQWSYGQESVDEITYPLPNFNGRFGMDK